MVQSLFSSNAKLTYVLSKTNFYLGTYEYHNNANRVIFSEYIPQLFALDEDKVKSLFSNPDTFRAFISDLQKNKVSEEEDIYELADKYLKIDEIIENDYTLGVVMDVTNTIQKQKKLQLEGHIDSLTGLYNRKGFETTLASLFSEPEELGHYAIILIMADGLVEINSTYGSDCGDIYLQKLANILTDFGIRNSIAARQWGGEFILFLYGYNNEDELSKALNLLTYIQNHSQISLEDDLEVPLEFSFEYYSSNGSECSNYKILLKNLL
jgi:diguanylate cyclase (GGDEF)-like protein